MFDKEGLDLVLNELDTISDFTRYLREREEFIRGGRVAVVPGEAELLGFYLGHADSHGHWGSCSKGAAEEITEGLGKAEEGPRALGGSHGAASFMNQ